jgi:CheY-like chemotaxis protein
MNNINYPNVLIVDDLAENLLTLQSMIEDLPINIFSASSGTDSLKILLKNKINLILLDINMPGISGIEVATLIKGTKKTKEIPIIFISGSREKNYDDFKNIFPNDTDFFLKPIDYDRLLDKIKQILDIK